jgi:hypothetical protein
MANDVQVIRGEIRLLVDPLIIKLRQELFGSGVSFGRITPGALPPTTVVIGGAGGTTDPSNAGFDTGIKIYSGGTLIASSQKEVSVLGAGVSSVGDRATIDIATPLALKITNPLTTAGDMLYGGVSGVPNRRAIGSAGQVLSVVAGLPTWVTISGVSSSGFIDPTTTDGDLLYRNSSNLTRLPIGASGQVLTVMGGLPAWQTITSSGSISSSGFTNPMTVRGDLIYAQTSGTATRLPIGSEGYYLSVSGGIPHWGLREIDFSNPMILPGDIIYGGGADYINIALGSLSSVVTASLGTSSGALSNVVDGSDATYWSANAVATINDYIEIELIAPQHITAYRLNQYADANFIVTAWALEASNDGTTWTLVQNGSTTSGTPDTGIIPLTTSHTAKFWRIRLTALGPAFGWAIYTFGLYIGGTDGSALRLGIGDENQVLTVISGLPQWGTNIATSGLINPMTTRGDIIYGETAGDATRLPISTSGYNLVSDGLRPRWAPVIAVSGLTNPMTTTGDLIYGGASGIPLRLAPGIDGQILSISGGIPTWNSITVSGGTSSNTNQLPLDVRTLNSTYGDHFTGGSLDAKWTRYTIVSGDEAYGITNGSSLRTKLWGGTNDKWYWQTAPAGDFEIQCKLAIFGGTQNLLGPAIIDSSGGGLFTAINSDGNFYIWTIAGYAYTGNDGGAAEEGSSSAPWRGANVWYGLRKVGTTYSARFSINGITWSNYLTAGSSHSFTVDRIGFGKTFNTTTNWMEIDWFDVI